MESVSLSELAVEHLAQAVQASAGRSAVTVHGRRGTRMRQTLMALAAGQSLGEHESPGEATLQVLRGTVRLHAGERTWEGRPGDLVEIPPQRHDLEAVEDAVVMLTVAVG